MDEVIAETEMKNDEYEDFKENAELKAIIAGQRAKKLVLDVNGIPIQIRAAIPKALRDKLTKIAKDYQAGNIESADDDMYVIMAKLCLDKPYTNPAAWKFIDDETGEVPNVMKTMIEKIINMEGVANRFRR